MEYIITSMATLILMTIFIVTRKVEREERLFFIAVSFVPYLNTIIMTVSLLTICALLLAMFFVVIIILTKQ